MAGLRKKRKSKIKGKLRGGWRNKKKKEERRAEQVFRKDGKIREKEEERKGKDTKNRRKRCDGCVR